MTRLLALDTSTARARVALLEQREGPPRTAVEIDVPMFESHATHLIDLIDRALAEGGWVRRQLDAFAVVCGPGSFTGVRIGLGTAQGLALAADCPCAGVNTLEAMAEASGACPAQRVVVLGAGRDELYRARYAADGSPPSEIDPPALVPSATLWDAPGGYVLWGAGAEPKPGFDPAAGRCAAPGTAAAAGRIALLRGLLTGVSMPPSPLYVRPPDAELPKNRG